MNADVLEIVHIGVTIALAIVGALVIQPLREIRVELGDLSTRLSFIEGRLRERDGATWPDVERRHGR